MRGEFKNLPAAAGLLAGLAVLVAGIGMLWSQPVDPLWLPLNRSDYFVLDQPDGMLSSPALLPVFSRSWADAAYQRIFWGIGEPLSRGMAAVQYCTFNRGAGLEFASQSAPIESRWRLALSFAQKVSSDATAQQATNRIGIFLGARAEILSRGYNPNSFHLAQPDDPLFREKTSKLAPNLSAGVVWRKQKFFLYADVHNLLFPDLAIEQDSDRLPVALQVGGAGQIRNFWVQANLRYSPRYGAFAKDFDPTVGVSFAPAKGVVAKARISLHSFGGGVAFVPSFMRNFAVVYDFSMPLEGIGVPSHNFGVKYLFAPPEPIFPDVVPGKLEIVGRPIPGETLTVRIPISNVGRFKTGKIPVAVAFGESSAVVEASPLGPNRSETLTVRVPALTPGDMKISVFLNRKSPARNAQQAFVEKDPDNNFVDTTYHIFAPPRPEISISRGELHLIQKFSVAEDEPLVPIFFFEQGDSSLAPRFDRTVEIIARRLAQNPDVELEIAGFVIDGEPDSLAFARARAVRRAIVEKYPSVAPRVKISMDHDIHRPRAKRQKFQGTRVGKIYTPQENRRVELYVKLSGPSRFSLGTDSLPSDSVLNYIVGELSRNPELILVVRARSIREALDYKEKLMTRLPGEFSERVFSQEGAGGVELILSPAGLIYRPPQVVQPAEGYEVEPGWDRVSIDVEPRSEVPPKSVEIFIVDGADTVVRFESKRHIEWDWKIGGEYPPPGKEFFVVARVRDTLGMIGENRAGPLRVVVQNINEVQQRLILLQFAFAGKQSESEYTNARMEYVARRVIERISAGDVDVIVAGHTDTIGTFSGNQKLSQKRAEEQLKILRKYLMAILHFDSDSALDQWIASHNATLTAKGYGMSRPYRIIRLENGKEKQILVGINTLPEGRIKNRRVEIIFIPRKEM